jgi:hypothetical protein
VLFFWGLSRAAYLGFPWPIRSDKIYAGGDPAIKVGNVAYIELVAKDAEPKIAVYQHPHFIIQIGTDSGTLFLKMQRRTLNLPVEVMKRLPKRTPR